MLVGRPSVVLHQWPKMVPVSLWHSLQYMCLTINDTNDWCDMTPSLWPNTDNRINFDHFCLFCGAAASPTPTCRPQLLPRSDSYTHKDVERALRAASAEADCTASTSTETKLLWLKQNELYISRVLVKIWILSHFFIHLLVSTSKSIKAKTDNTKLWILIPVSMQVESQPIPAQKCPKMS